MTQLTMLNLSGMKSIAMGRAEANKAIERVDAAADSTWKKEALRAVEFLAVTKQEFIATEVLKLLSRQPVKTRDTRALGAIMRKAVSLGLIEKSNRYAPNPERHCTPVIVWKSRIYTEVVAA